MTTAMIDGNPNIKLPTTVTADVNPISTDSECNAYMMWLYEISEASTDCPETVTLGFTLSPMTPIWYVFYGTSFGRSTTAMVKRETHTSFSCSSLISIPHTWLRFPM